MYVDMCQGIKSVININGTLSRSITEGQGIRQGAESSSEIYKVRANPVIRATCDIPDTLRIGSIPIGAPTCADDVCLLSSSYTGAQTALLVAQNDANRERYEFSSTKTKVLLCNSHPKKSTETLKESHPLYLNEVPLDYTNKETHLGIQQKR